MKITKEQQEFIKHIHSSSGVWDKDIEKKFPKLFKKEERKELEVCRWVKYSSESKWLMFYTEDGGRYGFDSSGNWFEEEKTKHTANDNFNNHYVTDEEVEEALIKEAKKRGFKEGVYFRSIHGISHKMNGSLDFGFMGRINVHARNSEGLIFENGEWAAIVVETITKQEAEKQLGKTIIN
jgi:hypothetical protein